MRRERDEKEGRERASIELILIHLRVNQTTCH